MQSLMGETPKTALHRFDWYLVEILGTFEDLFFTINCWEELGVEKYLVIPA